MAIQDVISSITSGGGNLMQTVLLIVVIGGLGVVLLGGVGAWWWFKKRWNLRCEIKLLRSDGKFITGEWGKAMFNSKRGVIYIKRPKRGKAIALKAMDVRRYLQGEDLLTVIQLSPDDYRPVLNDSWESYIDEETGEKAAMINLKIDKGADKAWKAAFEAAAKKAYSLQSFLSQFQTPIAIAIVLIASFVGFAILWTRIGA